MSDGVSGTIDRLTAELRPVRRLPRPGLRTVIWCAVALVVGAALYLWLGGAANAAGFGRPYAVAILVSSILTAVAAAFAAFQLSLPDRSDGWILLPLLPLVAWIGASGLGCLAGLSDPGTWGASFAEVRECLSIILGVSVPVSVVLIWMLRRALPLRPTPVAVMAGLAAAAAAGSVLLVVHPHNSSVLDLAVHAACVLAVVGLNTLAGGRILGAR